MSGLWLLGVFCLFVGNPPRRLLAIAGPMVVEVRKKGDVLIAQIVGVTLLVTAFAHLVP